MTQLNANDASVLPVVSIILVFLVFVLSGTCGGGDSCGRGLGMCMCFTVVN